MMRNKLIFSVLVMGVSFGSLSSAWAGTPNKPIKIVRSVGDGPVNKCGTAENQWNGSVRAAGLTASQEVELKQMIAEGRGENTVVKNGELLDIYLGCLKGRVVNVVPKGYQGVKLEVPYVVTSKTYRLSGGRVVEIMDKCGNMIVRAHYTPTPPPKVTYTPPPTPPAAMEPIFEQRLVEREVVAKAKIEYEAIAGVYVGASRLYKFRGVYAEGAIKVPVGNNNTTLLVGAMGMLGSGESRVSSYRGKESRYGPQIGLQHVYLKTHNVKGLDMQLPAVDTLKIRYLWDRVSGSNPDSGYSFKQRGTVLNLYAEHVERINPNTIVGVTAEGVIPLTSSIRSTWSGDRSQNRSYYAINGFLQKRISDDWQVRYIAGLAHQGWDKVNYLSLGAEARWKETIMCGPRLSLALNRPDSYKPYGRGSLHTLMAFCRLELGGTIRTMDRKRREKQWQLVQVGMRPVTREESLEPLNSLLFIPLINDAPVVNSKLTTKPIWPLVIKK
jgi:hypothetical protein